MHLIDGIYHLAGCDIRSLSQRILRFLYLHMSCDSEPKSAYFEFIKVDQVRIRLGSFRPDLGPSAYSCDEPR